MTYSEAHVVITTARNQAAGKPLANNTRLHERYSGRAKPNYAIRLHATDVLTFTVRGTMVLNSGGWRTVTTKERINRFLPHGYRVGSERGTWIVTRYTPNNPTRREVRQRTYRDGEPIVSQYPNWVFNSDGAYVQDGMTSYTYTPRIPDGWERVTVENPHVKLADFQDGMEIRISDGKVTAAGRASQSYFQGPKPPPARKLTEPVLAWHVINADHKAAHGDLTIEVGKTYRVKGEPIACHHGLHASIRLADALRYNPGPIVCRVELSGKVDDRYPDKLCATRRKVLWMVNAENLLLAEGEGLTYLTEEAGKELEVAITELANQEK